MRRYTSRGRIVSYFEDAPVAVRLLPKGAAALVPCDRAQFLSHFQKFHISCTKVRLRACVRACVRACLRCAWVHAGGHSREWEQAKWEAGRLSGRQAKWEAGRLSGRWAKCECSARVGGTGCS